MLLDVSADHLHCDLITHCPSKIPIFSEFSTPQMPLDAWELAKDGPRTQTLAPGNDVCERVPGWEGAKERHVVGTHLHCLNGDIILLRTIGKELLHPLLDLTLPPIASVLG